MVVVVRVDGMVVVVRVDGMVVVVVVRVDGMKGTDCAIDVTNIAFFENSTILVFLNPLTDVSGLYNFQAFIISPGKSLLVIYLLSIMNSLPVLKRLEHSNVEYMCGVWCVVVGSQFQCCAV